MNAYDKLAACPERNKDALRVLEKTARQELNRYRHWLKNVGPCPRRTAVLSHARSIIEKEGTPAQRAELADLSAGSLGGREGS